MYDQQDHKSGCDNKYVVVCLDDFCNQYGIRKGIRSKFGLNNGVEGLDEASFERYKKAMSTKKRDIEENKLEDLQAQKKPCYGVLSSFMEGSTLEGSSQELSGWSQLGELNEAPDLLVSEDIGNMDCWGWDPSMTILESEQQEEWQHLQEPKLLREPELLRSDEFHKGSSPPFAGIDMQ